MTVNKKSFLRSSFKDVHRVHPSQRIIIFRFLHVYIYWAKRKKKKMPSSSDSIFTSIQSTSYEDRAFYTIYSFGIIDRKLN